MSIHHDPSVEGDALVVVGGGAAGTACVEAYRQAGGTQPVILVSDDDRPPYFRPDLTKSYFTDDDGRAAGRRPASLQPHDWYSSNAIELITSTTVDRVDLAERVLSTGLGPLHFDQLVLALGSDAAALPIDGGEHPGLHVVRNAADASRLFDATSDGGPVLVVGSGFVGCEVAGSLRLRGLDVSMVSREPTPQSDRLGPPVGALIGGWLADSGIRLRSGVQVTSIDEITDGFAVRLADGSTVEAAHVVVASGAHPRIALAESAGLAIEHGGVRVDASMRTGARGVFAVGDIAFAENSTAGRRLRVEHWGDAEEMGRIAGLGAAGIDASWTSVPGFWSTILGHTMEYVAWGDGWDALDVRRSSSGITIAYGREGVTVGVLTSDHPEDAERAQAVVAAATPFPPA